MGSSINGHHTPQILQPEIEEENTMKKSIVALTVIAAVAVTGTAFARMGGMGPGMGPMMAQGGEMTEQQKKFIADTMPVREEMHKKHMEMQQEYIKEKPDTAKISKLQGEMLQLRQKMYDARVKSGLPMGKMGGKGMMKGGKGMGPGMGPMMAPAAAPAK